MGKPIKKIIVILLVILFLPLAFFTFREVSSLDENEKMIGEIYKNQLESILFSVNQYSEDIVRSWITRLETIFENNPGERGLKTKLEQFFTETQSLREIFISDSTLTKKFYAEKSGTGLQLSGSNNFIEKISAANSSLLKKLYRYVKSGFVKIEPLKSSPDGLQFLMFVFDENKFCVLGIDAKIFVQKNLTSKIQSVARDQFSVAVYRSNSETKIYQTDEVDLKNIQQSKNLWLVPYYNLGILLKGKTIDQLVKERSLTNIVLLAAFTVLMVFTAMYAFGNIKKEVELAQIKNDFVSNVSHELRTPLALISMFAETLEMGRATSEEKKREYYGIINHEANRLSKIVNRILSFSQIEAGKKTYSFSKIDLNNVAAKIFETYNYHLTNKGCNFHFEPSKEAVNINGDGEAVSEAIINLIDNAVKYSGDKKFVSVKIKNENGFAVVEVEDNGIGIPPDEQRKIFDKFYRASKGLVHNTKGTGLGLALVKHIIDAHKGKIELTSEVGKGSKFRLLFPLIDS
ncbi:MAG: HAMP domain-containing histidine kinase [Ignavibacteriales bacterium]|nr:HAMP domain-containing histidine kinase [Ignavibacteriales bacterium]